MNRRLDEKIEDTMAMFGISMILAAVLAVLLTGCIDIEENNTKHITEADDGSIIQQGSNSYEQVIGAVYAPEDVVRLETNEGVVYPIYGWMEDALKASKERD